MPGFTYWCRRRGHKRKSVREKRPKKQIRKQGKRTQRDERNNLDNCCIAAINVYDHK